MGNAWELDSEYASYRTRHGWARRGMAESRMSHVAGQLCFEESKEGSSEAA